MLLMVSTPLCCSGKVDLMRSIWLSLLLTWGLAGAAMVSAAPLPAQGTIEVLFTPWVDAEGAVIRAVTGAQQSIYVQAYLITSHPIATALIAVAARGVEVQVLADHEMAIKGANSQLGIMASGGVSVWLETRYAAAHNKVIIIDAVAENSATATLLPVVITGSYNYTWSAQARNAENLLVIRGNAALAKRYLENWRRHRADAQALTIEGLK